MLSALASLGFTTVTDGFWAAMLFRALGGVALAGSYMPGLKLLTDHLEHIRPGHDNSRAVAFYTASFGIGTSLSFFMAGEIAAQWDWHTAFAVTVAGPLLGALLSVALLPRTDPSSHQAPSTHLLDFARCCVAAPLWATSSLHRPQFRALRLPVLGGGVPGVRRHDPSGPKTCCCRPQHGLPSPTCWDCRPACWVTNCRAASAATGPSPSSSGPRRPWPAVWASPRGTVLGRGCPGHDLRLDHHRRVLLGDRRGNGGGAGGLPGRDHGRPFQHRLCRLVRPGRCCSGWPWT